MVARHILFQLIAACALLTAGHSAFALESPWTQAQQSAIRLLAAGPVAPGDGRIRAGIEIKLTRGWHTYWRYPGDAGVPPRFDWRGSENVAGVEVLWPAPRRILTGGSVSIGYEDGVVFPLRVRPADPAKPVKLALKFDYAVCERLCIPAEAHAALHVPPGGATAVPALTAAEGVVPRLVKIGEPGSLAVLSVKLERGATPRAVITARVPAGPQPELFAEGPTEEWALAVPEPLPSEVGMARFALPIDGAPPGAGPIPSKLRLTLVVGKHAIETEVPLD